MNKFIVMVGFPGSGKSTYANKLAAEYNATIFSSDALRKELYGSESVQDHNEEVFNILSKRMLEAIKRDENVIYDAMNISSKYRRNILKYISCVKCEKIAYLIATPYEECLRRNSLRDRVVPDYVIKRAYMNFTMPCKQEGFDEVKIIYPEGQKFKNIWDAVAEMRDIDHENIHHEYPIGKHMESAYEYLSNRYKLAAQDDIIRTATLIHDIGKPFTKTHTNMKGEVTTDAHYYNHNNVGAYDSLFLDILPDHRIDVALLIQYHMHYYTSWKQSDKAKKRDLDFLGFDLAEKLDILHECDLNAH